MLLLTSPSSESHRTCNSKHFWGVISMDQVFKRVPKHVYRILDKTLDRILVNSLPSDLSSADAAILLSAKDSPSVSAIAAAADACRAAAPCKDLVTYVVNRNINFTNACVLRCGFCAFSRTGIDEEAYFLPLEEIVRRAVQAASLGATEICIQVMAVSCPIFLKFLKHYDHNS